MNVSELLTLPLRYKPWKAVHLRLVARDLFHRDSSPASSHRAHLEGAIDWLCRAQDRRDGMTDSGAVSAGWSFEDGWLPGYPETTGYIIETLLAASELLSRPELRERVGRMIDWELSIQHDDGAFPGHFAEPGSHPVVFNTGQIMHGMIAGYVQLRRDECLEAAVRSGHWLNGLLEADGRWLKYEHNGVPHVYNTRAAWALLATGMIANEQTLVQGARSNLDWALSQQTESGWFETNAFLPSRSPFTHTIAYAIRGLMESGVLLHEESYFQGAEKAARGLLERQRSDGWLAGSFRDGWVTDAEYCCLTGVAQMCLNWLRLAALTGDARFKEAASRSIAYLKTTQRLQDPHPAVKGGIAGSSPIWGAYSRFEYPNWAAKFFADALMMDMMDTVIPPVPEVVV